MRFQKYSVAIAIASLVLYSSCENEKRARQMEASPPDSIEKPKATNGSSRPPSEKVTQIETKPSSIKNLKFFFENSGSMNGYISEYHEIKTATSMLLSEIDHKSFFAYLINTELHKFPVQPEKVHTFLTVAGIKKGNIHTSDLNFILKTVLDSTNHQDVGVLVTDGIYSVEGDPNAVLGKLRAASNFTAEHFENRLKKDKNLQTVLIKLSSQFKGQYYPVQGKGIAIDQKRPYYIWLFGSAGSIASIQTELNLSELPGYKHHLVFSTAANKQVNYKIIPGLMNRGTFRTHQNHELRSSNITDVKKDRRSKDFQFTVGIDLKNVPVTKSYLLKKSNYEILNNTNYTIAAIQEVDKLATTQRSKLKGAQFSHIVTLHTTKNPYGNLNLTLKKQLPSWVSQTHSLDDTNIRGDEKTTLGFSFLIGAIDRAYSKVSKSNNYINLPLHIQR